MSQESPPKISDAEWEVMNLVWENPPLTSQDIVGGLKSTSWNHRTIKTLIARLVKKGVLGFESIGQRYLYHPLVSREDSVRAEGESFLRRVAGGSLSPLLAHFVAEGALSDGDLRELRKLIDAKEQEIRGDRSTAPEGER